MRAVRFRHVLGHRRVPARLMAARMQPDPRAALEDLDGGGREADVERLVHQRIRHRVVVAIDLDVVIDVDARLQPVGMDEALGRQRLQGRPIKLRRRDRGASARRSLSSAGH